MLKRLFKMFGGHLFNGRCVVVKCTNIGWPARSRANVGDNTNIAGPGDAAAGAEANVRH